MHSFELREIKIAFVAKFMASHVYRANGSNKQVVPQRFKDEDKASSGFEDPQDLPAQSFRVVCEMVQRRLAERKGTPDARLDEYRWLLEELRVSLFAQELRTPQPVSAKRLDKAWAQITA